MSYYELIYIVRPDLTTDQVDQVNKRLAELITAQGGQTLHSEFWGRRDLAYEVRKNSKGYYVYHVLEGAGSFVREVEARIKIDEDIIKYLTVRVEKPNLGPSPMSSDSRRESQDDEIGDFLEDINEVDD